MKKNQRFKMIKVSSKINLPTLKKNHDIPYLGKKTTESLTQGEEKVFKRHIEVHLF